MSKARKEDSRLSIVTTNTTLQETIPRTCPAAMNFWPFPVLARLGKPLLILYLTVTTVKAEDQDHDSSVSLFGGDPSCPCVAAPNPIPPDDLIRLNKNDDINTSTYGIGCGRHDTVLSQCKTSDPLCDIHDPRPSCDQSWCSRQWCYVDPTKCSLYKKESFLFPNSKRFYSYATCYERDKLFPANPLEKRILRFGLNCNTGGYGGAYCLDGLSHFKPSLEKWDGPAVKFALELKKRGHFEFKVAEPPLQLKDNSIQYFNGSDNEFDLCVYAVGLGYLDLCVAQYSVTDLRIGTGAKWFILSEDPIYLFVFEDEPKAYSAYFVEKFLTVFKPFQPVTWAFVVFVIIVMGILMVVLDYRMEGSDYMKEDQTNEMIDKDTSIRNTLKERKEREAENVADTKEGEKPLQNKKRTFLKQVMNEIYTSFLSVLQGSHSHEVVSAGGKIILLGFSFVIVVIHGFYIAGLIAMLVEKTSYDTITTLEHVVAHNYTICGQRLQINTLLEMYKTLNLADYVVVDNDGMRGLNCPDCEDRQRVFDSMIRLSSQVESKGCQAAIAPLEDFMALRGDKKHCDKKKVGEPIFYNVWGMPVFDDVAEELIPLMLKMKSDRVYEKEKKEAQPEDKCTNKPDDESVEPIGPWDLLPLWIIFYGCAVCALVVDWVHKKKSKRRRNSARASANTAVVAATNCRPEGRMPASSSSSGPSYDMEQTADSRSDSTIGSSTNSVASQGLSSNVNDGDWFEVSKAGGDASLSSYGKRHPMTRQGFSLEKILSPGIAFWARMAAAKVMFGRTSSGKAKRKVSEKGVTSSLGLGNIKAVDVGQNANNDHCNDYDDCGYPISSP